MRHVNLLRGQVAGDARQGADNFVDKWLLLTGLQGDKAATVLAGKLDRCIAVHVLDVLVGLVDNRLEKHPVGFEKAKVLANNVRYYVARNDGLVAPCRSNATVVSATAVTAVWFVLSCVSRLAMLPH